MKRYLALQRTFMSNKRGKRGSIFYETIFYNGEHFREVIIVPQNNHDECFSHRHGQIEFFYMSGARQL